MEEFDDIEDAWQLQKQCSSTRTRAFTRSPLRVTLGQTRQANRDYGDRESEWKIFMDEARGEADDSKIGRTFRFRFGLQLSLFRDIYNEVLHLKWFGEADKKRDATGK